MRAVLAAEPAGMGTLSSADRGFAIYRTAQVAAATGQPVLLRLDVRHVPGWLRRRGLPQAASGSEWAVGWAHRPQLACDATLPCPSVPGRVLYVQVRRRGFRPRPLSLFTTLTDPREAPLTELVALYVSRWQVELRSRDLKTTLGMECFDVRSSAMFAKELEVGVLAYTLIRLAMLAAAPSLPAARRLAFAACRRRVCARWAQPGLGPHPAHGPCPLAPLRRQLAACRIPRRRRTVAHEPRAVRRSPHVYPALKGPREAARRATCAALGAISS